MGPLVHNAGTMTCVLCTLCRDLSARKRKLRRQKQRPEQLMEGPHPNLNQVSFDTQKVGHKWVHTSEIPVTRGEGKKHLGIALWPIPGVTVGMGA